MTDSTNTPARIEFTIDGHHKDTVHSGNGWIAATALRYRDLRRRYPTVRAAMVDERGSIDVTRALASMGTQTWRSSQLRHFGERYEKSLAAIADTASRGEVLAHIKVMVGDSVEDVYTERQGRITGGAGGWVEGAVDSLLTLRRQGHVDARAVLVDAIGEFDVTDYLRSPGTKQIRVAKSTVAEALRRAAGWVPAASTKVFVLVLRDANGNPVRITLSTRTPPRMGRLVLHGVFDGEDDSYAAAEALLPGGFQSATGDIPDYAIDILLPIATKPAKKARGDASVSP